jgi:siderophore synthetase component
LDQTLGTPQTAQLPKEVRQRLAVSARKDLDQLLVHLSSQAKAQARIAERRLEVRGKQEAADMRSILKAQRTRIRQTAVEREQELQQLALFAKDEAKQLEADKRHWRHRLDALERELESEPARIVGSYEVRASRFEPVGLVYLWPVTG